MQMRLSNSPTKNFLVISYMSTSNICMKHNMWAKLQQWKTFQLTVSCRFLIASSKKVRVLYLKCKIEDDIFKSNAQRRLIIVAMRIWLMSIKRPQKKKDVQVCYSLQLDCNLPNWHRHSEQLCITVLIAKISKSFHLHWIAKFFINIGFIKFSTIFAISEFQALF